jgi:hypothetical protein
MDWPWVTVTRMGWRGRPESKKASAPTLTSFAFSLSYAQGHFVVEPHTSLFLKAPQRPLRIAY